MDLGFSVRLESVVNITNILISQGKPVEGARGEAKSLEKEIYEKAKSTDHYRQCCAAITVEHSREAGRQDTDQGVEVGADEVLNNDGPTFGDYIHATFHQDGQMSTIFKAKAMNEQGPATIVALKVTSPAAMQPPHNSEREARILDSIRHECVVPLLNSFRHQGSRFVLVFPFMRQELENLLRSGTITPRQTSMVFESLFGALAYVHSMGVIHRDVKPTNILLQSIDGPVFLADFGIAWSPTDPQSEPASSKITEVGTTRYRAPEVLFGDRAYSTSFDIWAAGCVVAEMVRSNHHPLFDAGALGSELGLIKSIFTTLGTPTPDVWPSVVTLPDWGKIRFQSFPAQAWSNILHGASAEAVDFVKHTVCYEPSMRLTAAEALRHSIKATLRS